MIDIGLTHIALPVSDIERSIEFYSAYARMEVIHRPISARTGLTVVWLSDKTRPFAIVLIETSSVTYLYRKINGQQGEHCNPILSVETLLF